LRILSGSPQLFINRGNCQEDRDFFLTIRSFQHKKKHNRFCVNNPVVSVSTIWSRQYQTSCRVCIKNPVASVSKILSFQNQKSGRVSIKILTFLYQKSGRFSDNNPVVSESEIRSRQH